MKYLLSLIIALVLMSSKPAFYAKPFASTYHFAASGNDATGDGSSGNPWQTVTKFNTVFSTANADDQFLFNRGDAFAGALNITRSGTSGHPIVIGAYGSGADPIVTGFSTISSWTSIGGGLYEATVGSNSTVNMVVRDGSFQPIGRYPNKGDNSSSRQDGYNLIGSHSTTSVNSTQALPAGVSFTGGEIVIRAMHWILDRHNITSNSGNSINFTAGSYAAQDNFGYFVQNVANATVLDQVGEWAYNGATHKLTMQFGGGGPGGAVVKASTAQNLVSIASRTDIKFDNVQFDGSNNHLFSITGSQRLNLTDCALSNAGVDAMNTNSATSGITLLRTAFSRSNNNHIRSNNAASWDIQECTFLNNGMVAGMGGSGDGTYFATSDIGNNSLVQYNSIVNSGYNGINYNGSAAAGNNIRILNNFINGFCLVKDDGAGIYTGDVNGYNAHTQCRIENNIVINGVGATAGAGGSSIYGQTSGIYMDDYSINTIINNNTVAYCGASGIYLHLAKDLTVTNNTTFGNFNQEIRIVSEENASTPISNITLNNNIFFNMTNDNSQQFFVMVIRAGASNRVNPAWGAWDNNYYCRPRTGEAQAIIAIQQAPNFVGTLAQWKTASGKDANSKTTGVAVTDPSKIRFEYNATASPTTISFPGTNYRDVRGTTYSGSIVLQPYTSAVLIQTTTSNVSPTVDAGSNITTSGTSVTVSTAAANDPDGTYTINWTKIVGGSALISNGTTLTPTFSGLVPGTYQFQATVTDNGGATATDAMTVTVTGASNSAPSVSAGTDVTITLPINTVSLTANGTDAEGAVTYLWSRVSGSGTISSTGSKATAINGLLQGVSVYRATVTDLGGLTASDDVQITVNAATPPPANKPPSASAGTDATITLPTNSVTLTGSGVDQDGSISSYAWTYLSGPMTFNIVNPSSAQTTVNNLGQGTYQFKITVTDDDGAQTMDNVTVTVNPNTTPPVPGDHLPVSKAGNDIYVWIPATSTEMNGLVADFDGPVTAMWTQTAGVAAVIESPTLVYTVVKGLREGTYEFELTATDNVGQVKRDRVKVFVRKCNAWYRLFRLCK